MNGRAAGGQRVKQLDADHSQSAWPQRHWLLERQLRRPVHPRILPCRVPRGPGSTYVVPTATGPSEIATVPRGKPGTSAASGRSRADQPGAKRRARRRRGFPPRISTRPLARSTPATGRFLLNALPDRYGIAAPAARLGRFQKGHIYLSEKRKSCYNSFSTCPGTRPWPSTPRSPGP
jgi:hypothetical protein